MLPIFNLNIYWMEVNSSNTDGNSDPEIIQETAVVSSSKVIEKKWKVLCFREYKRCHRLNRQLTKWRF